MIQSIMFGSSSFGLFFALPVLSSRLGCSAKQIILLANLWQAASWAAFGLSTDATLAFVITACFFLNGIWWPTFRSVVTSIFGAAKYHATTSSRRRPAASAPFTYERPTDG